MPAQLREGVAAVVKVPGSSANLGPGFDSVGLALGIWDTYLAGVSDQPGWRVFLDGRVDEADVPDDERHLVVATMRRTWRLLGLLDPPGVVLRCRNTVPQGRGLGSSAAAIVAGVALAQTLATQSEAGADHRGDPSTECHRAGDLDLTFTNDVSSAFEGHPDNASASVYGGMTLSWVDTTAGVTDDVGPPRVNTVRFALHPDIEPVVFLPTQQLPTATARAVLPRTVPHRDAALNAARVGLLVHAATTRPDLLLPATRDWLHQEQRRAALSGAMELLDDLRAAGHAAVISGAGPSVLVLATTSTIGDVLRHLPPGWRQTQPGVPGLGVSAERATVEMLLGENVV